MRRNELTIVAVMAVLGLLAAFWLAILSPKREDATTLKDEVDQLNSQLQQTQQAAAAAKQARASFAGDYRKLVVLGKAVPADGDQASLLVQLQRLADRSGVRFQGIDLSDSAALSDSATATTPAPTTEPSTADSSATATSGASSDQPAAEPTADPTEAAAATLPIGASVGPAGLPVMPYDLEFTGNFFQIADFMKQLDAMVRTRQGAIDVDGRLLTVDAFNLAPIETQLGTVQALNPVPTLTAALSVTTYLTPADEGITAGATPGGPAPATSTTTSTSTTGSTVPPTATSSPVAGATAAAPTSP
jgi:Tfp pilus assembly protein PilO